MILIFRGKILSDDKALSEYGLKDGSTLILTMKKDKPKAQATASTPTSSTSRAAPAPASRPAPTNHMIPPHMQQMMHNMLQNPDFIEMIMNHNPQMQQLMQQNP